MLLAGQEVGSDWACKTVLTAVMIVVDRFMFNTITGSWLQIPYGARSSRAVDATSQRCEHPYCKGLLPATFSEAHGLDYDVGVRCVKRWVKQTLGHQNAAHVMAREGFMVTSPGPAFSQPFVSHYIFNSSVH